MRRGGPRRWVVLAIVVAAVAISLRAPIGISLAGFTAAATSNGTLAADTLAPPTNLTATAGASILLSWTPTVDAYATGYSIERSATSGGPYSTVGSVTPGSAVSATDLPAAGTWYYVLRSTYQAWSSVSSGQVSATLGGLTSTAFSVCTSNAADTSGAGDNNGYEVAGASGCVTDAVVATDSNTGTSTTASCGTVAAPLATKDRHRFWGNSLGLPASVASIDGIRVQANLGLNATGGTTLLCAQLSWDGGTTWTTIKSTSVLVTAVTTYTFGTTSDTWGHVWTPAQFAAGAFRVRLIDAATQTTKQFRLDGVAVSVTYTP